MDRSVIADHKTCDPPCRQCSRERCGLCAAMWAWLDEQLARQTARAGRSLPCDGGTMVENPDCSCCSEVAVVLERPCGERIEPGGLDAVDAPTTESAEGASTAGGSGPTCGECDHAAAAYPPGATPLACMRGLRDRCVDARDPACQHFRRRP